MSDLQKKMQQNNLPLLPPIGLAVGPKKSKIRNRDFTPVTWEQYFERMHDVEVDADNIFRVYERGSEGPVCLFLHGGGYSGLSWALMSKILTEDVNCRCAALDLRGHGDSKCKDEADLSANTMAKDVGDVVKKLYGDTPPPLILIGHSMGGALAIHATVQNLLPSQIGLVVIDVVEGTAIDALSHMQSFLRERPNRFKSLQTAIEWCVKTGQTRNLEAAKVSMVGQLKRIDDNTTANAEMLQGSSVDPVTINPNVIHEEEEEEEPLEDDIKQKEISPSASKTSNSSKTSSCSFALPELPYAYTWRIDLSKTEPHWRGWFEGMSELFLSCSVPKMLILAGVDRLDKALTVGQMQGKFQMQVLPQCGHAVHEDVPDKVAEVLATFMVRHKVAEPTSNFHRSVPAC